MKKILLYFLIPFIGFSQTQIGADIDGIAANNSLGYNLCLASNGTILAAAGRTTNFSTGQTTGYVSIYQNISETWTQLGASIYSQYPQDSFGESISFSGDANILAISARYNDVNGLNTGQVKIYQNVSGVWTQIGNISGSIINGEFGKKISLSSDGAIIAVSSNGINNSGKVQIYQNISGVWTQIGQDINGEAQGDNSGISVSLSSDGTIVAIGANLNSGNGQYPGHVRVYRNISGVWTQIGQDINGEAQGDNSGISVSLSSDGTIVAIGANLNSGNGQYSGHVRVYQNISGVWVQVGQDINGEAQGDSFGSNVSLSSNGTIIAIGAKDNDGNGQSSGHVRIYQNISGVWTQVGQDINGEAIQDRSGVVSLSSNGTICAIGAEDNDGSFYTAGHVRVYDLSTILSSETFVLENFTFTPNPTSNQITIHLQENIKFKKATIYNTLGQIIKIETSEVIDVSDLSIGTYFIEVITDKGKATKSFIKE